MRAECIETNLEEAVREGEGTGRSKVDIARKGLEWSFWREDKGSSSRYWRELQRRGRSALIRVRGRDRDIF